MGLLIYIIIVAFIAEIAGTIAGFGSSSILLPLLHGTLSYEQVIALVAIYHLFGNAARLSMFYKHINKKIVLLFGVPSIICTIIGAYMISGVNVNTLKILLGVILIIFSLYSLYNKKITFPKHTLFGVIGGGLSGFTAGIIGTGGVLRGAFLQTFNLSKESYIATIAIIALIVDFTRIPIYLSRGYLDQSVLYLTPILFIIAFVGSRVGRIIVKRIPQTIFRNIIYGAIILLSLKLIYDGVVV